MQLIKLAIVHFLSSLGLKLWPHAEPFFKRHRRLGLALMLICMLAMFLTLFVGCALFRKSQEATRLPLWTYKADVEITVDGKAFDGMAVTTSGAKPITIKSKARMDLLLISSCHREFSEEKVDWESSWFGLGGKSARKYTYNFVPTEIEKESFCPIYIQAFARNGIAAWGFVAFRTTENLPAKTECNGRVVQYAGISVCQSRKGFEQGISFDRPVRAIGDELCKIKAVSDREFRVRTTAMGFCKATFTDGKDRHRLVLLGYDEVLVRGE